VVIDIAEPHYLLLIFGEILEHIVDGEPGDDGALGCLWLPTQAGVGTQTLQNVASFGLLALVVCNFVARRFVQVAVEVFVAGKIDLVAAPQHFGDDEVGDSDCIFRATAFGKRCQIRRYFGVFTDALAQFGKRWLTVFCPGGRSGTKSYKVDCSGIGSVCDG